VGAQDEQVRCPTSEACESSVGPRADASSTAATVQEEVHDCIRPVGPDRPIDSNRLTADCV
jgi:hypothetical protein